MSRFLRGAGWSRLGARWPGRGAGRNVDVSLRRALLAVLAEDLDAAESHLAEAARADSDDADPYLALARLYRIRGEMGRAIRIHQNLLLRTDLKPANRMAALSGLARDYREGGFLRRAIASYEEVLAHDSRHRESVEALVDLLADVRDHPRALAMARRLERLERRRHPEREAKLLLAMARDAHAEGRHDAARKAARRSLKKNPRNAAAAVLLGQLEAERGRSKAALAAWDPVPFLDGPDVSEVYPRLEATYAALERPRDYEKLLRRVLEEKPGDEAAGLALARTLAARGDVDPAISRIREVLDRDPSNLEARATLGRILLAEHRDTDAVKEYGELLEVLESSRNRLRGESFE